MKKRDKKSVSKNNSPKTKEPMSPQKKLALKIALLFVIFGMILCCLIFGAIYFYKAICTENSNYTLRNIRVISNGYWNNKSRLIGLHLNLIPRKSADSRPNPENIFSIDIDKLRSKALELPGVKNCEVRRILPDSIEFNIVERFPRAVLSDSPNFLLDEDGVVLNKKYCSLNAALPLVIGLKKRQLKENQKLEECFNAMQIIVLTLRSYSDIEISAVDVSKKDSLTFYVRYNKGRSYRAIMPNSLDGIDTRLKALRTALIRTHNSKENVNVFNLTFDGRVICK